MLSQHHRRIDLASTLTFALGVAGFASAALMGCTQGDILAGAAPIAQVGSELAVDEPNFAYAVGVGDSSGGTNWSSVNGGSMFVEATDVTVESEPVIWPGGPLHEKYLETEAFASMSVSLGLSMSGAVNEWVEASWDLTFPPRDGEVRACRGRRCELVRRFRDAVISEITFPAVGKGEAKPALLTIKARPRVLEAPTTNTEPNGAVAVPPPQGPRRPAEAKFVRVRIDGLPVQLVKSISALAVKFRSSATGVPVSFVAPLAAHKEIGNLSFTVAATDAGPLRQWFAESRAIVGYGGTTGVPTTGSPNNLPPSENTPSSLPPSETNPTNAPPGGATTGVPPTDNITPTAPVSGVDNVPPGGTTWTVFAPRGANERSAVLEYLAGDSQTVLNRVYLDGVGIYGLAERLTRGRAPEVEAKVYIQNASLRPALPETPCVAGFYRVPVYRTPPDGGPTLRDSCDGHAIGCYDAALLLPWGDIPMPVTCTAVLLPPACANDFCQRAPDGYCRWIESPASALCAAGLATGP